jgi:hypothetical protein
MLQVGQELGQRDLGLVEHEMFHVGKRRMLDGKQRLASHHLHARLLASR